MVRKILNLSELDLGFKYEVAKTREGRTVLSCIQCGICSSSCPFSEQLDYKPHELVKMILLGMREEVLSSEKIWACATCYMCAERCPQKVELGNVLMAVANMAAREKGLPEQLANIGGALFEEGRVIPITEGRKRERDRLGLPPAPVADVSGIRRIIKEEGVAKLVGKEERR